MGGSWFGLGVKFMAKGQDKLVGALGKVEARAVRMQGIVGGAMTKLRAKMQALNAMRMRGFMMIMGSMAAAAALFYPAISAFAEFNATMAQVGIVSGQAGDALKSLRADIDPFVTRLGILTEFSPKEVAGALYEIASSGRSSAEELKGLIPHVLTLSTMSGQTVALGDAATLLIQTMSKFGKQFENLEVSMGQTLSTMKRSEMMVDMLGKTVKMSLFKMKDFSIFFRSLGASGAMLESTTMPQFLAMGAAMREIGDTTAQAGHGIMGFTRRLMILQRHLLRLEDYQARGKKPRPGTPLAMMLGFGITKDMFVDAQGNMRDLFTILDNVNSKFATSGKSQSEVMNAMVTLFTAQGAKALIGFNNLSRGIEVYNKATGQMEKVTLKGTDAMRYMEQQIKNSQGEAARFNVLIRDTLKFQQKLMAGSRETLMISFGDAINKDFSMIVSSITTSINVLIQIINWNKEAVASFAKWAGIGLSIVAVAGALQIVYAMLALTVGKLILMPALWATLAMWQGVATAALWVFNAATWANPMSWVIAAAILAIVALVATLPWLYQNWENLTKLLALAWERYIDAWKMLWEVLKYAFFGGIQWIVTKWKIMVAKLTNAWRQVDDYVTNSINKIKATMSFVGEHIRVFFVNIGIGVQNAVYGIVNNLKKYLYSFLISATNKYNATLGKVLGTVSTKKMKKELRTLEEYKPKESLTVVDYDTWMGQNYKAQKSDMIDIEAIRKRGADAQKKLYAPVLAQQKKLIASDRAFRTGWADTDWIGFGESWGIAIEGAKDKWAELKTWIGDKWSATKGPTQYKDAFFNATNEIFRDIGSEWDGQNAKVMNHTGIIDMYEQAIKRAGGNWEEVGKKLDITGKKAKAIYEGELTYLAEAKQLREDAAAMAMAGVFNETIDFSVGKFVLDDAGERIWEGVVKPQQMAMMEGLEKAVALSGHSEAAGMLAEIKNLRGTAGKGRQHEAFMLTMDLMGRLGGIFDQFGDAQSGAQEQLAQLEKALFENSLGTDANTKALKTSQNEIIKQQIMGRQAEFAQAGFAFARAADTLKVNLAPVEKLANTIKKTGIAESTSGLSKTELDLSPSSEVLEKLEQSGTSPIVGTVHGEPATAEDMALAMAQATAAKAVSTVSVDKVEINIAGTDLSPDQIQTIVIDAMAKAIDERTHANI